MKKNFIVPLALLIILIFPLKVTYANTNQNLNFSTSVNGSITESNKQNRYKITLNKSGRITINSNIYFNYLRMNLVNSNGDIINGDIINGGSKESPKIYKKSFDLDAGTYYIDLDKHNGYDGNYTLKVDYKEVKNDSIEPNNGTVTAQQLPLNSNPLNGYITVSNDKDFYKINLPKSGKVTVNTNSYLNSLQVKLINSNGYVIEYNNIFGGSEDNPKNDKMSFDLDAGTYYINLNKYSGYTGSYTLKVDYKEVANDSIEPNNGTVTAQPLQLNSNLINGHITVSNRQDYYKIYLPIDAKIVVNYNVYMGGLTAEILDENGNREYRENIWSGTEESAKVRNIELDLKAGTYYVTASVLNSYTGRYTLKVSTKYSVDQLYNIAYKAANNAVNVGTQKAINDARKAINDLKGTGAAWAIGQLSGQVDKAQHKILVNIISSIKKAQSTIKQEDINKAKAAIDPDLPLIWKNSYSSAVDSIQNKLMNKAIEAYKKANKTQSKVDIDNANALIADLKKSSSNAIVQWANAYFK